ncbi:MAG: hypothetical protein AAF530_01375 [Pseudomonadota bacterium]
MDRVINTTDQQRTTLECGTALTTVQPLSGPETELEGVWMAVAATVSGQPAPQIVGQRLSFRDRRFKISKDGRLCYGGTFSLDPMTEAEDDPARIRFHQTASETLMGTWQGIYERSGNALTIVDNSAAMTKRRPISFAEWSKEGYVTVHFVRQG